jgi:hypothetical protein
LETSFDAQLRTVQGDVRISPGVHGEPRVGNDWRRADAGIELHEGNTIATQEGSAEIELENGSVIYVASHSVLMFDELATVGIDDRGAGYDRVDVRLIAGSAIFLSLFRADGIFIIRTPTAELHTDIPALARVTSYLNETEVEWLKPEIPLELQAREFPRLGAGFTMFGNVREQKAGLNPEDPWEVQVKTTLLERFSLTIGALRESHLEAPFGGLLDLYRNGKFTECGDQTCWRPSEQALEDLGEPSRQFPSTLNGTLPGQRLAGAQLIGEWESSEENICGPVWAHMQLWRDANGKLHYDVWRSGPAVAPAMTQSFYLAAWQYAACNTGVPPEHGQHQLTFKRNERHCRHHHHHEFCTRWVTVDGRAAIQRYVRVSGKDKEITQANGGVYLMPEKRGERIKYLALGPTAKLRVLDDPPKEYRREEGKNSAKVAAPVIVAQFRESSSSLKGDPAGAQQNSLRQGVYDYGKGGFMVAGEGNSSAKAHPMLIAKMNPLGGFSAPTGKNADPRASSILGGGDSSGRGGGAGLFGGGRSGSSGGSYGGPAHSGGGDSSFVPASGSSGGSSHGASTSSAGGGVHPH